MAILRLVTQEYRFRAVDSVFFPPGKAGNVFRGALGLLLPAEAGANPCVPERPDSGSGGMPRGVPGGMKNPPRPFALRAAHLDGVLVAPAREFAVKVHFFDLRGALIPAFGEAMRALEQTGLGPRRPRVEFLGNGPGTEVELDLSAGARETAVTVKFVTPTELKGIRPTPSEVPFGILFARARDRVSSLLSLYGDGLCRDEKRDIPFAAMGSRAATIRLVECKLEHREIMRQSTRTGQRHGIGGFTGSARYEGDLAEFLPYLRAAWWTGVGRHTVWGNGVLLCE